jgi:hypothetical protein
MPWEANPSDLTSRPTGWWVSPVEGTVDFAVASWLAEKHHELDPSTVLTLARILTMAKIGSIAAPSSLTQTSSPTVVKIGSLDELNPFGFTGGVTAEIGFNPTGLPALTAFSTAGATTYTIPRNCNYVDIVCLGGGGGGQGGGALNSNGEGGNAASWATATKTRGTDFPWSATTFNVTVGAGGAKGTGPLKYLGTDGGASSVVYSGTTLAISAGGLLGSSGATGGDRTGHGPSPATQTFNGQSYAGGSYSPSSGQPGADPGGGGCGGNGGFAGGTDGYAGAKGKVWIYAY